MTEIWLLSDLHVMHANIIRYCNRPFKDEYEMNDELLLRWNTHVKPDDIGIIVGDLSAGLNKRKDELATWCRSANGKKILVRGNHDHQEDSFYIENGFTHVCDHLFLGGILWAHVPSPIDPGYPSHFAKATATLQETKRPLLTIHGHEHRQGTPEHPGHFNCAADRHEFTPFTLASALDRCHIGNLTPQVYDAVNQFVGLLEAK